MNKQACYYEFRGDVITCKLCPHGCKIHEGQLGKCRARQNFGNVLYSINYGEVSSINIDPIEKKPLKRFMPNTNTLSIGTFGCNLSCPFCQNYSIAAFKPDCTYTSPEEIVDIALRYNLPSISYTYNEPAIFYEFMLDCAVLSHNKGLKNIMITNGFIEEEPLIRLLPYLSAMNIDLKTFDENIYTNVLKGGLETVKKTIATASKNCHVEVSTLIVPKISDSKEQLIELFKWLSQIDVDIVLHLSRYFPRYNYYEEETSIEYMKEMYNEAKKYLNYVYLGNV